MVERACSIRLSQNKSNRIKSIEFAERTSKRSLVHETLAGEKNRVAGHEETATWHLEYIARHELRNLKRLESYTRTCTCRVLFVLGLSEYKEIGYGEIPARVYSTELFRAFKKYSNSIGKYYLI